MAGARAPVDPVHLLGAGLGSRDTERAGRRVNADDLDAAVSEKQRERAHPAANVQHPAGAQLVNDGGVHVVIAAVGVKSVVDRDQPRMLEDGVAHAAEDEPVHFPNGVPHDHAV